MPMMSQVRSGQWADGGPGGQRPWKKTPGAGGKRRLPGKGKGDASQPAEGAEPGREVELIDLGKEMAAYIPLRRPKARSEKPSDGPRSDELPQGDTVVSPLPEDPWITQPLAAENASHDRKGSEELKASPLEQRRGGPDMMGLADRLSRVLLRSSASLFASLDGDTRGREQIEYCFQGEGGGRYLFAKLPPGLFHGEAFRESNGHRRAELSLPCLRSSLQVVKESLAKQAQAAGFQEHEVHLLEAAVEEVASHALSSAQGDASLQVIFETAPRDLVVTIAVPGSPAPGNDSGLLLVKGMVEDLIIIGNGEGMVAAMRWRGAVHTVDSVHGFTRCMGPQSSHGSKETEEPKEPCQPKELKEPKEPNPALADVRRIGREALILTLTTDKLDSQAAPLFSACLTPLMADRGVKHLILDFSRVKVLGSSCLGILIKARSTLTAFGRRLTLVSLDENLKRVLEAAGLLGSFEVQDSLADVVSTKVSLLEDPEPRPAGNREGRRSRAADLLGRLATWFALRGE